MFIKMQEDKFMKRLRKKLVGFLLVISMIMGSTVTPIFAINNDARLDSTKTIVTTTYNNCYASTVVYVSGYEVNPSNGQYQYYNKSKSTTNTGEYTFTHVSDNGRKFVLSYNGKNLTSEVFVGGISAMTMQVQS